MPSVPSTQQGRPERRARKSSMPAVFGLTLVLLVLAGAVVLFALTNKKAVAEPPKVEQKNPFADMPPEPPPEKQAKTKGELQREQQK